jgi:hypothetical protein
LAEATLQRLEVEPLDLGDVRGVGLELLNKETREPVTGAEAAAIWAAVVPGLAGGEPWGLDFFAHAERVSEFCKNQQIDARQANAKVVLIPQPDAGPLRMLFERFANETFGVRSGALVAAGDPDLEDSLASHGVDAYHRALGRYVFCAVCDFENGFLTILSEPLWASEVIRRARRAVEGMNVDVERPT